MRTLTDTLKKAQQSGFIDALVKIVLTFGASTYTYTKPQILDIKNTEDGSLQYIELVLDNSDGTLTALDLRGFKGILSSGAITSAGEEYSACAPMWVLAQEFDSDPNKLTCTITLVGICNLMATDEASEAYQPDDTDNKTVKTLIGEIIGATLACFNLCKAYEVVWDAGYDTLADTYKPKDAFRIYVGNNRNSAIDRLLDYTLNVKVVKADGKIHIFKPTTTGTTYDYEYSLENGHPFFSKALRNRLVTPNYIKVQSRDDDDPKYSGIAKDPAYDSLPDELKKHHFKQTYLESAEQAEDIAEAILAKAQMWCEAGAANVPLNVGAEAFDYVKVTDKREGDYRVGNTGRLVRHYNVTKNEWRMAFVFGNWQNVRKALAGLGITSDDLENYFSRLQVGDLYAENLLAKNMGFYWIDPEGNIDLDKIGDNLDNLPDGEQYARVSTWNLKVDEDPESPTYGLFVLNMDEHTIYQPGYDPNEKRRTFTATPTTPYDVGDLWVDATTVKRCITARATGAYVAGDWIATTLDAIENGDVFSRVKSMALSAAGLVMMDQVIAGTYGKIKSMALNASGMVLIDNTIEGTYGKIKSVALNASGLVVMDQVVDGTYGKLKATDISAGHILLSSNTLVSGEWYNEAGVEIDANYGINIYGQNNALTTRATKTGAIQCSVNSQGQIVAGGGDIILDSSGVTCKGLSKLRIQNSAGTLKGYIGADTSGLYINSLSGRTYMAGASVRLGASCVLLLDYGEYMDLPRKSSPPTGYEGRMVYNHITGYLNVYSSGAWWHANRDAGWA